MTSFTLEKVLYFARKQGETGFNVGPRDLNRGTTLGKIITQAKGSQFLVEAPKGPRAGKYFSLTPLGETKLAMLQGQFYYQQHATLPDDRSKNIVQALTALGEHGQDLIAALQSLNDGPRSLKESGVSKQVLRDLHRLGALEQVGKEKGDTTVRLSAMLKNALPQEPATETPQLQGDALNEQMVDTLVKALDQKPYFTHYHDDTFAGDKKGVPLSLLLKQGVIHEAASDDAGTHYQVTPKGIKLMLTVELELKQKAGFPTEEVKAKLAQFELEHPAPERLNTFDKTQSYDTYQKQGRSQLNKHFGEALTQSLPELFWDDHYFKQTPIATIVDDIKRHGPPESHPMTLDTVDAKLQQCVEHVMSFIGDASIEQIKGAVCFELARQERPAPDIAQLEDVIRAQKNTTPTVRRTA